MSPECQVPKNFLLTHFWLEGATWFSSNVVTPIQWKEKAFPCSCTWDICTHLKEKQDDKPVSIVKPIQFESECHRDKMLQQTAVEWTLRLGRKVAWSVRGWTDRLGTMYTQ